MAIEFHYPASTGLFTRKQTNYATDKPPRLTKMHFTCKLWPCQAKNMLSNKAPTLFSCDDLNQHVIILKFLFFLKLFKTLLKHNNDYLITIIILFFV